MSSSEVNYRDPPWEQRSEMLIRKIQKISKIKKIRKKWIMKPRKSVIQGKYKMSSS